MTDELRPEGVSAVVSEDDIVEEIASRRAARVCGGAVVAAPRAARARVLLLYPRTHTRLVASRVATTTAVSRVCLPQSMYPVTCIRTVN